MVSSGEYSRRYFETGRRWGFGPGSMGIWRRRTKGCGIVSCEAVFQWEQDPDRHKSEVLAPDYHIIGGATMAKKVVGYIKLQIPAGKATPAPPVGPALGQHGVNIVEFTKQFNARTADKGDLIIPVVITVYADRSFSFVTKTPPAAVLLKKACNLKTASAAPNKTKVATISKDKVREIAEMKMPDLNAASVEAAMSMIAGTARSMGIVVED